LGKTENGIVVVTAYGVFWHDISITLKCKPKERLKPGEQYHTKPSSDVMRKLESMGFKFNLVLADSLYGESGTNFISVLDELNLNYSGDSLKSFRRATSKTKNSIFKMA